MHLQTVEILLADDDDDDCLLFEDALKELPFRSALSMVDSGDKLMQLLVNKTTGFPDVIFLDLNMPRKSGYQCLSEIKDLDHLKHIPVVIFSTSYEQQVAQGLYNKGAHLYIRKPTDFSILKRQLARTLSIINGNYLARPQLADFLLHPIVR